jgi:GPH family glycoside/pentoside/hexuronide:cation symporter
MLSLVTTDGAERSQLSTWRSIGSMVGNLLPQIILPMLIWEKAFDANGQPILNELGEQVEVLIGNRVFLAALIMGVLGFIAFLFMIKKITIRVDENTVKTTEKVEKFNVIKAFGNFMKNRAAVGATLAAMAMFLGMNSATTATTIMFATYFNMASLSGLAMAIGFVPMLFFMPFIKKIVNKYGKKESSAVGALVSVFGGILMFVFPLIPNKTVALVLYIIALSIFGIGLGIYTCVSWALMADAIDYNEYKMGVREEGVIYSLHSFFRKLAQGVGPSIVLLLMGALGYVSSLGTDGQSIATAYNMCWLVSGLYLFSAVLMFVSLAFIYNLDKKKVAEITAELEDRRAENTAEEVAEDVATETATEEVATETATEEVTEDVTETEEKPEE